MRSRRTFLWGLIILMDSTVLSSNFPPLYSPSHSIPNPVQVGRWRGDVGQRGRRGHLRGQDQRTGHRARRDCGIQPQLHADFMYIRIMKRHDAISKLPCQFRFYGPMLLDPKTHTRSCWCQTFIVKRLIWPINDYFTRFWQLALPRHCIVSIYRLLTVKKYFWIFLTTS